MSETTAPNPTQRPAAEADGGRSAVPVWLFLLLFLLLYWAMVYFDQHSGWLAPQVYSPYRSLTEVETYQPPTGGIKDRGKIVYESVAQCVLCHNTDGTGKPGQAPPLVKSEWALGSANRMIRIPVYGLNGPIQVDGKDFNLSMPAMGAALSDEDVAAVLTYIRQSWGNNASDVTPEQVAKVRKELGNRGPFSTDELKTVQ